MTWQITYQSAQDCVFWQGYCAQDSTFDDFLQGPVVARLNYTTGHDALIEHLSGLSLTGMGHDSLEEVLAIEVPETRDWAVGEALAEAVLEEQHGLVLPWNTERDKHNSFASLSNLPSQVYYGVATDEAISLRLLGVPRSAAPRLAEALRLTREDSMQAMRQRLEKLPEQVWSEALGREGAIYHKTWMIMDGE